MGPIKEAKGKGSNEIQGQEEKEAKNSLPKWNAQNKDGRDNSL